MKKRGWWHPFLLSSHPRPDEFGLVVVLWKLVGWLVVLVGFFYRKYFFKERMLKSVLHGCGAR